MNRKLAASIAMLGVMMTASTVVLAEDEAIDDATIAQLSDQKKYDATVAERAAKIARRTSAMPDQSKADSGSSGMENALDLFHSPTGEGS